MVRRGWFLTLSAGVAFALAVVLILGSVRFRVARSRFPERGLRVEEVAGCPAEIRIRLDGHGVPHVRTDHEQGLWFAQGYVHARDRFFQMDLARRLAAGRLADVFGAQALASDRQMRTWRLASSAGRQAALLDGESRVVLEAYADGVNAALEQFGRWIAPEIWLLGVKPEAWRPENSLEIALLLQLDLSWSMGEEFQRAVQLSQLGRERAADLWGWSPFEASSWLPPGNAKVGPRDDDEPIRSPYSGVGSNSWALAPRKTATGRALLATDPHDGVSLPGPFAMIHLSGPGFHVAGASVPGTPGVLIGHNEHVAWSFTAAMLDDQDLFVLTLDEDGENELVDGSWVPLRTVTEEIRVRWQDDPVLLKIRMSEHGPLVRDSGDQALAMSWTGFGGDGIVRAMLDLNRSVSAEDAAIAWDGVVAPSMSLVAADTGGHILHQVVGLVPNRGRGAGRLPAPGADSNWSWRGFLPYWRNPHTIDPAAGMLATANHDFFAEGDYPMESRVPGDFASPWRVRRIRRALEARDDWDVAGCLELQRDVVSERAIVMLKQLRLDLVDHGGTSAKRLLEWDGRMTAEDSAPHLFSRLVLELGAAVGSDEWSVKGEASAGLSGEQLVRLLGGGMSDDWWDHRGTSEVEDRADGLTSVLDALDVLDTSASWGEVHQVAFNHPLAGIPVAGRFLARSWNRGPFPASGDNVTVEANSWSLRRPFAVSAMPALRLVMDVGNWDRSVAVMPLGQSGRPWSSHYADQVDQWRRGEAWLLPFSDSAVNGAAEAQLILRPKE